MDISINSSSSVNASPAFTPNNLFQSIESSLNLNNPLDNSSYSSNILSQSDENTNDNNNNKNKNSYSYFEEESQQQNLFSQPLKEQVVSFDEAMEERIFSWLDEQNVHIYYPGNNRKQTQGFSLQFRQKSSLMMKRAQSTMN